MLDLPGDKITWARTGERWSDRMLRIKSYAGHFRCTDLHAPLNNFEHRVQSLLLDKGVLVRVLNLHRD